MMITDRGLTHLYGISGILITATIALAQSQAVRSFCFLKFNSWRSKRNGKYNARIQKRIDLIVDLANSSSKSQAYFFSNLLLLSTYFVVLFFFAVMLILRALPLLSVFGFLGTWSFLLIQITEPLDVAIRLRNPEKSIEWLEGKKTD